MTVAARPTDPASFWLGGGIAAALALAALPWLLPIPDGAGAPQATSAALPTHAQPMPLSGLDAFPETRQRPLFTPDRRPAPSAALAESGVYRLIGIVSAPGARRAMLRGAGGVRSLAPGDRLDDWTVLAIEAERVVLSRGAERLMLSIGAAAPTVPGVGSAGPFMRGRQGGGSQ
jgi:hypothetical protein